MTLAIDAALVVQNGPAATLTVTGATGGLPVGGPAYQSDWSVDEDGWAGTGSPAPTVIRSSGSTLLCGDSSGPGVWTDTSQAVDRTITGLVSGHHYRVTMLAALTLGAAATFRLQAAALTASDPFLVTPTQVQVEYVFTATGASHVLHLRRDAHGTLVTLEMQSLIVQEVSSLESGATIQRTDANGSRLVRLAAAAEPDGTGAMTVTDEEFALHGTVTYVVRDASGATASDALTNHDGSSTFAYPTYLAPVALLDHAITPARMIGYDEAYAYAQDATNAVQVIGRADPVAIQRADALWTLRTGTMTFWAATYPDARDIAAAHRLARVTMLRVPDDVPADLYYVPGVLRISQADLVDDGGPTWRWRVDVDYVETGWPAGDLSALAAWSWDDLLVTEVAWWNVAVTYATWADVLAGP